MAVDFAMRMGTFGLIQPGDRSGDNEEKDVGMSRS